MATWSAPVRYGETDQQGIVFNAHYLLYADEGVNAWVAQVGTPYAELMERGLDMHVRASTLSWESPARFGDVVDVDVVCERVGGTSWVLLMGMRVADRTVCTVRSTYVLVDGDGRPVRVPDDLRERWLPEAVGQVNR